MPPPYRGGRLRSESGCHLPPHLEHVIYRLVELAQPTTAIVLSSPISRRTIGAPVREDH